MAFILAVASIFSYPYFSIVYAASDITNAWTEEESFPAQIASQVSFVDKNKLFIIGGATAGDYSDIYSTVLENGELSDWQKQDTGLPQRRYWAASVSKDKVYLIAGASLQSSGYYLSTVISGSVDSDGNLTSWQIEPSLPDHLGLGAATIIGNRIFYSGGFNNSHTSDKVYSAVINPDGSLNAWEEVSVLPFGVAGHGMLANGDYLYILGGGNKVLIGKVNIDGTISSWQENASFSDAIIRPGITMVDNYIYIVGGNNIFDETNLIYFTTVNSDGSLEPWQISTHPLLGAVQAGNLVKVNDYLFYIGGYHNGYLDTVYKTKLNIASSEPEGNILNVPLYMQTDDLWKDQVYDSATVWAPSTPGIYSWGCAMTSAVMIFRYQGITKLPDGQDLNPGTLNTWLKNQSDGYVNTGWVNWLALARLSKLAKSQNPSFTFDALEYSRISGYSPTKLSDDIEANIPGILEVPGHFIVGKGVDGESFKINDPFYDDRINLSSYNNTFLSLGRFVPSHTDLSYMMLMVEDGITMSVKDKDGNVVGEGFTQQPIYEDGGDKTNGKQFYMYYVKKPINGIYTIEISSPSQKSYSLQIYMYDQEGTAKKITQNGAIGGVKNDTYELTYDRQNLKKSSIKEMTTYENLLADIEYFYSKNQIKNKNIYLLMKKTVMQAKNSKSKKISKGYMTAFIIILDTNKKRHIDIAAYEILKSQAASIVSSL